MPQLDYPSADDMDVLLSLPNLRHVVLGAVQDLPQDYSSHPCKWEYLELCLYAGVPWLNLDTLAKLPLHSLKQPLILGDTFPRRMQVALPKSLAATQRLSQQLMKCGVKVLAVAMSWTPYPKQFSSIPQPVHAFEQIATASGPHADVHLHCMTVDQALLHAVAAVNCDSLEQLTLHCFSLQAEMHAAWRAVLSACPSPWKVVKMGEYDIQGLTGFVQDLMAAMAQQPGGRCIALTAPENRWDLRDTTALLDQMKEQLSAGTPEGLAGIEVEVKFNGFDSFTFRSI